MKNSNIDILIVGASAAGITAAIFAKRENNRAKVVLIERNERIGKKLLKTGNGRCNITNKTMDCSHYNTEAEQFVRKALYIFSYEDTINYFNSMGVLISISENGLAYPKTLQATTVLDALRLELELLGIEVITGTKIETISQKQSLFYATTDKGDKFCVSNIILACGGNALPSSGSDGNGLILAKNLGIKATETYPSLVKVRSEDKLLKSLKGIRADGKVTLLANNKQICKESGQVQFLENGLSGICVMQLSRKIHKLKGRQLSVSIDLMPELSLKQTQEYLYSQKLRLKDKSIEWLLAGALNKRLGNVVFKKSQILDFSRVCDTLTSNELKMISYNIKELKFTISDTFSFNEAQVTAGGLNVSEFCSDTMQAKKVKGLFACGELLDVDGECGGYNLQWAWTSGYIAGRFAGIRCLKEGIDD